MVILLFIIVITLQISVLNGQRPWNLCLPAVKLEWLLSGGHDTGAEYPDGLLSSMTATREKKLKLGKGEETEWMDASLFKAALSRTNTAAHVFASFQDRVINTPVENT